MPTRTSTTADEYLEQVAWDTTIGQVTLLASKVGLCRLALPEEDAAKADAWYRRWFAKTSPTVVAPGDANPILQATMTQLDAYLTGTLREFSVPLDLRGTVFQVAVWRAVLAVPFGVTRTYQDIAVDIGKPRAVRAVGAANGANPVAIIVPCHRLIGADGTLHGYGGGLPMKGHLLALEGVSGSWAR